MLQLKQIIIIIYIDIDSQEKQIHLTHEIKFKQINLAVKINNKSKNKILNQ